jgi:hypothetical protein
MFGKGPASAAHSLSSPAYAGDPVRRGFTAQALLSLEYWIARSSRATTSYVERWIASLALAMTAEFV